MRDRIKAALHKTGGLGFVFRLYESAKAFDVHTLRENARYRSPKAPAGIPIPPPSLIVKVAGTASIDAFLEGGRRAESSLRQVLAKNGIEIEQFEAMLDFGCGCGRVIRYWQTLAAVQIYGTDYNPRLIEWCRRNLPFARFEVNALQPPLPDAADKFDFIYALSVFTHLTEDLQHRWLAELRRVLKPNGYLLITTHGDYYLDQLTPDERRRYQAGELVIKYEETAGTNLCAAFCTEAWVRSQLTQGFEAIDYLPQGALGNPCQDLYLLRKISAAK